MTNSEICDRLDYITSLMDAIDIFSVHAGQHFRRNNEDDDMYRQWNCMDLGVQALHDYTTTEIRKLNEDVMASK